MTVAQKILLLDNFYKVIEGNHIVFDIGFSRLRKNSLLINIIVYYLKKWKTKKIIEGFNSSLFSGVLLLTNQQNSRHFNECYI